MAFTYRRIIRTRVEGRPPLLAVVLGWTDQAYSPGANLDQPSPLHPVAGSGNQGDAPEHRAAGRTRRSLISILGTFRRHPIPPDVGGMEPPKSAPIQKEIALAQQGLDRIDRVLERVESARDLSHILRDATPIWRAKGANDESD